MDGREQLRRYLEQRRELGERELVLDSLTAEEALRLIAGSHAPRKPTPVSPPPSEAQPDSKPPAPGDDWRAALRAAGVTPPGAKESAPPPTPAPEKTAGDDVGTSQLQSLGDIAQEIAVCTRCPLSSTARNPVPGEGNPNAKLVLVGEAPGATEDETGRPFVGAAGQLLTKILAAIDLTREQVFICNVLKHRPPSNRNPEPDEVVACSPYLVRQIALIKPNVIIALGKFAAQTLLSSKLSIDRLRGQIHRYHGVPLIVTYHPAALLRNPSWKRPTWEDVQLARRILDSSSANSGA